MRIEGALSIAEAARKVGYSPQMLRVLDPVVQPIRWGPNQARVYLREHLDAIRAFQREHGRKRRK